MKESLRKTQKNIEIIEECLPGRTTDRDDPQEGEHMNGATPLKAILLSHQPLDLVLIMLGTNDFKVRFQKSAYDIAYSLVGLALSAKQIAAGKGGWHAVNAPQVGVICPAVLGTRVDDSQWARFSEWQGARAQSEQLAGHTKTLCEHHALPFLDANQVAVSSSRDPIHWSAETHHLFGQHVAEFVKTLEMNKRQL